MENPSKCTVAVVQYAPVFLDRAATVALAHDLIVKAGQKGANLVVFPEAFIPGYPDWVWVAPAGRKAIYDELYTELIAGAVTIPDETTEALGKAARDAGVFVAIGVNERNSEASNASLYNTILYIDGNGEVIDRHRKLVPTGGERLIWAQGHGNSFESHATPYGKVGGLVCWENYMPLARYAIYQSGVQIYVAPTWDSSDVWLASMRHIAKESGAFVIGCCSAMHIDKIPDRYEFKKMYPDGKEWINPGNSCVVNPKGQVIAGPLEKKEDVMYVELDLRLIPASKWILDTAGHYSRPDVFAFAVRESDDNQE
jgi:nitrilase